MNIIKTQKDCVPRASEVPCPNRLCVPMPNGKRGFLAIITAFAALFTLPQQIHAGLRDYPAANKIPIGAVTSSDLIADGSSLYSRTLAQQFNLVGCDNQLKMYNWSGWNTQTDQPIIDFVGAENVLRFANANGMKMRGHVLLYDQAVPGFLRDKSDDEIRRMTEKYVKTVVAKFKGKISSWDVANEFLDENGALKAANAPGTFWRKHLSKPTDQSPVDWLIRLYSWVGAVDPNCSRFYCDYNIEWNNTKFDGMMATLQPLITAKVLDGIAFQCHIGNKPTVGDSLAVNARKVYNKGLEWQVTELDVDRSSNQAQIYEDVARVCFTVPGCTALMLWGVDDGHAWEPGKSQGIYTYPLLFDASFNKKPAYYRFGQALSEVFPKPGIFYKIYNRFSSDKHISVVGGNRADAARIQNSSTTNNNDGSDLWQFINIGSGYYKIQNKESGKSFDISGGSVENGADLQQFGTGTPPGTNQQWRLSRKSNAGNTGWISDDHYAIINLKSQKPVWPAGGSAGNGALLEQNAVETQFSAHWLIDP
jgi:endo-1,4-beta-xylanase